MLTASFMSCTYDPCQRKVLLPFRTSSPLVSTSRPSKTLNSSAAQSSPTTPTSRTGVKNDDAYEK